MFFSIKSCPFPFSKLCPSAQKRPPCQSYGSTQPQRCHAGCAGHAGCASRAGCACCARGEHLRQLFFLYPWTHLLGRPRESVRLWKAQWTLSGIQKYYPICSVYIHNILWLKIWLCIRTYMRIYTLFTGIIERQYIHVIHRTTELLVHHVALALSTRLVGPPRSQRWQVLSWRLPRQRQGKLVKFRQVSKRRFETRKFLGSSFWMVLNGWQGVLKNTFF